MDRNSRLTGHITDIEKVQDLWTKFADFLIFDVFLIGILKKIQFFFKMQIFDRGTKDIPSKHILPNPTPTTEARRKFLPLGNLKMKTKCVE